MKSGDFERLSASLSTLSPSDLAEAAEQERRSQPIMNKAVNDLRKHASFTAAHVMGSNSSHQRIRSEIWSTVACFNSPSIWLTINPDDLHDLIFQVFAGEDIDLDTFEATAGPDKFSRAKKVAEDPCAAAEFFHFMVQLMLKHLFQVSFYSPSSLCITDAPCRSKYRHQGKLKVALESLAECVHTLD